MIDQGILIKVGSKEVYPPRKSKLPKLTSAEESNGMEYNLDSNNITPRNKEDEIQVQINDENQIEGI